MKPVLVFVVWLASWTSATADVPRVVADIAPVHSLVAMVMDGLGTPRLLVTSIGDAHDLQLRPSQGRMLSRADVIFWVGPEFSPWLDGALGNLGPGATSIAMLDLAGTRTMQVPDRDLRDPHAWLDPQNALSWVDGIARTLARTDPHNAPAYLANAAAAKREILQSAQTARAQLTGLAGNRYLVSHNAFRYFARWLNINVAASFADASAGGVGAARLATLRRQIKSGEIACVFYAPGPDENLARFLVRDAETPLAPLDPLGADIPRGPGFYPRLISSLAETVANCAPTDR